MRIFLEQRGAVLQRGRLLLIGDVCLSLDRVEREAVCLTSAGRLLFMWAAKCKGSLILCEILFFETEDGFWDRAALRIIFSNPSHSLQHLLPLTTSREWRNQSNSCEMKIGCCCAVHAICDVILGIEAQGLPLLVIHTDCTLSKEETYARNANYFCLNVIFSLNNLKSK